MTESIVQKIPQNVLCVCLGNICRSPTAEAVLRQAIEEAGLKIRVDSAGTSNYHPGKAPDPRSQQHARSWGLDLSGLRARQVTAADFEAFELILAMDRQNLHDLRHMAAAIPPSRRRAVLALYLHPLNPDHPAEVMDPYYGGAQGFEQVLRDCTRGAQGWIRQWQS